MSVVCEEIFDENSHPSDNEVRDYAAKIGIDPDTEPDLLPLAAEGLMKALPPGWKPCYDDKRKCYYYYNNLTGKTQWEHPLDEVYRGLVKKVRAESQSLSLGEPTEDATYARDEIPSYEEPPPIKKNIMKLAPLKTSPQKSKLLKQKSDDHLLTSTKSNLNLFSSLEPKNDFDKIANILDNNEMSSNKIQLEPLTTKKPSPLAALNPQTMKLVKQQSEDLLNTIKKTNLNVFNSLDEKKDFDKHPRSLDKTELTLTGGGSMFLKTNVKKSQDNLTSPAKSESIENPNPPRSILRERSLLEISKSLELDKLSLDKSEKDDDDKKSVRFNLDNTTDIAFTLSDKSSSSDEDIMGNDKNKLDIINVKVTPNKAKSRFNISSVNDIDDPDNINTNLKLIKPNPTDFIQPKLTISKGSDSEDDSYLRSKRDSEEDEDDNENNVKIMLYRKKFEEKAEKRMAQVKQNIWEEKNDELLKFRDDLQESHQQELERILTNSKKDHEDKIKSELENIRIEMENRNRGALKEERLKFEKQLDEMKSQLEQEFDEEKKKLQEKFESKKEELEKYYEEKLADIEKDLAEKVEKNRDELVMMHNSNLEQLKQNHAIIIEQVKKELNHEEEVLRREHKTLVAEIKNRITSDSDKEKHKSSRDNDEKTYDKLKCEKKLLEDKYRCLKDKYMRLKTEVKISMEKRHKRKEQGGGKGNGANTTTTTTTTGSETERSYSNNKEKTPLNSPLRKPPTPKHNRNNETSKTKPEHKTTRQLIIQDLDTSASDKSDDKNNKNDYDSSDNSMNPGRSRKKLFSRLKSSSTSRINNNSKTRRNQRSCSPVENLRRQLQKLEDLEDQFPQNPQSDTYHLRYPFSDGQKFEGSSELEFFRHRIHLERDSIKRAKESLRSQKTLFQQRQKELKLKHGSMARHTLQQLCQEEKELTDMEVSLHRTRSLLGEKVIRLRHLEQSLQRATMTADNRHDDATLSDLSSHSASSGISSTEFATADGNFNKGVLHGENFQESSEIIQSLENLNSEIREIWDVLRKQQQSGGIATVIPPLVYPDLGWPLLAGAATVPAPPSIPTLADRLHNYRQHVALANAQSTMVTHANQGATTTLVERTRNLRHWLRQAGVENNIEGNAPQATL